MKTHFWAALVCLSLAACDGGEGTNFPDMPSEAGVGLEADMKADLVDAGGENPFEDSIFFSDTFLNIAHRGGGRLAPEETLVAYTKALAAGAHVIECDAHATSDGVVVCMHDDSVGRTTDGSGTIRSMTFEEIRALDAGYNYTSDGGVTYPYRGQGVQVATLDEIFESFPTAYVSIELKQLQPSIVDEFLEVVDRRDAASRIVVVSFSDATIKELREARSELLTAMALGEMLTFNRLKPEDEAAYVPPGLFIQAPADQVTGDIVEKSHRLGLKIHAWTVNDSDEFRRLRALGVDGIFTDDPELLDQVISE